MATNVVVAAAALLLGWWSRPQPVDLRTLDLDHAAEVLDIERLRLQELSGALTPSRESSVSGFVSLQTQAAALSVIELSWAEGQREGPLVPVELTLRFSGDPLHVPILADGLYNLSLPLAVRSLELRFIEGEEPFVLGRVVVRFWRTPELDLQRLPSVEGLDPELARLTAEVAVGEAARQALSERRHESAANRRWLMTALPALILSGEDGELSASDE